MGGSEKVSPVKVKGVSEIHVLVGPKSWRKKCGISIGCVCVGHYI